METTFGRRRRWITGQPGPLVLEVVKEFPCLQSTKVVSRVISVSMCLCLTCVLLFAIQAYREFRQIVNLDGRVTALMDSWPQLETKLVEYAKVEASTRPAITKCLKTLEEDCGDEIASPTGEHIFHYA